MSETTPPVNKSPGRIFGLIERVGNKIPNPFILVEFAIWQAKILDLSHELTKHQQSTEQQMALFSSQTQITTTSR
ncbi:hypothetical protein C6H66_18915 [Photorhabdus hindustanensis]|uniref:Uncharacterized protein n=1 Tax=Photorhabdus hindustanensis TaxID=2918802 RepID=A0A2S8PWX8_9GAMM|nr:hypothetical protein C6H66_18915 [Photorhabdus hindustanensis]